MESITHMTSVLDMHDAGLWMRIGDDDDACDRDLEALYSRSWSDELSVPQLARPAECLVTSLTPLSAGRWNRNGEEASPSAQKPT